MSFPAAQVPAPLPSDHEDVAWALRAAQAEWTSGSFRGAVRWVERAAETAEEVGALRRSVELLQLVASLSRTIGDAEKRLGRPPSAADLTAEIEEDVDIEVSETEIDLEDDDEEELDLDMDDATEVIEVDAERPVTLVDVEEAGSEDDEPLPSFDYPEEPESPDFDDRETWRPETVDAATLRPAQVSSIPDSAPTERPLQPSSRPPSPVAPSRPPQPAPAVAEMSPAPPRGLSTFKRSPGPAVGPGRGAFPPARAPGAIAERTPAAPSALEEHRVEAPRIETPRPAPPIPDLVPPIAPSKVPLPAVETRARAPEPSQVDFEAGAWMDPLAPGALAELDFDDEAPTRDDDPVVRRARPTSRYPSAVPPAASRPPESFRPAFPTEAGLDLDLSVPAEVATARRHQTHEDRNEIERELGIDLSLNLKPPPSRAAASTPGLRKRSTFPPNLIEPFLRAPSASVPPTRPIEPPSHPMQAPPPDSMREPDAEFLDYDYPAEEDGPPGAMISAPPVRPVELPPPSSLDVPVLDDEPSVSPDVHIPELPRQSSRSPGPADSLAPLRPNDTVVDGVHLLEVPGLGEFSKDALALLVTSARHIRLNPGEEVNTFAAALVTRGTVQLMPTVADASCATVRKGGVIFSQGTVEPGIELRVVGFDLGTRVVVFGKDEFAAALRMCPWVHEELRLAADSYQAMAGAVMGPLGESFDEMFRSMVLEKLNVRSVGDGEAIATQGKPLEGVYVIGAGHFVIEGETGRNSELGPGDFVFPETLLSAGPSPRTVRARGNALALFAARSVVNELFATCPPFIELLAQG